MSSATARSTSAAVYASPTACCSAGVRRRSPVLPALRIAGAEPVVPGRRLRQARRPLGVVVVVVRAHRHDRGTQRAVAREVAADVHVLLALQVRHVAVAERQDHGRVHAGRDLAAECGRPDQDEALHLPGIVRVGVDRRALDAFPAAAVADQHDFVEVHAALEAAAPGIAAVRGPFGPLREVMPDELGARGRTAVLEHAVLAVDAVRGDGDDEVALRGEHVRDVTVAGMARHRAPARKARPVAGGFAVRPAAIAGAVAAVQEQHERHRACEPDRRRDFGQDLDRRGIVRERKSRQLVLQATRFVRTARGGIDGRLRDGGLRGRRDRRHPQLGLACVSVDATAGGPDGQVLQRRTRRQAQPQRVAALHRIAEHTIAGTDFVARAAHANRRVARPHEFVAFELPSARQRSGSRRGSPGKRRDECERCDSEVHTGILTVN